MDRPALKLIRASAPAADRPRPAAALALAVVIAGSASLATWWGADEARQSVPAQELVEQAMDAALNEGSDSPKVRGALAVLRTRLVHRPLDSKTRVRYAGLLLGLSRSLEDTRASAFHARRAAELAPVTVPVVRTAALVLVRTGHAQEALALVKSMFGYDPPAAAALMARMEPLLLGASAAAGVPHTAEAYLAWSWRLTRAGRIEEADRWLQQAHASWPDHLRILEQLAARAVSEEDWDRMADLFPPQLELPDDRAAAMPMLYRAMYLAARAEEQAARRDVERALQLSDATQVWIAAGDAYRSLGDFTAARRFWNRALFGLSEERVSERQSVIYRLAKLEDTHGRPAAALRLWESLLELTPDHAEARTRVDDLSGFRR